MHSNKASRAYYLRELCGGGNSEPNDTLKNVKCSQITTARTDNTPPVSKGGAKNSQHHDEGAANRRA